MTLPDTNFAELAVDLYLVACEQTRGLAVLEGNGLALAQAGRDANIDPEARERMWAVYESSLREARDTAVASEAAHLMLKALAPFEVEIRALLAAKQARAA